jgi:SNF2-related domain
MMKLETLKAGISLVGIEPTLIATVIAVVPIGDGAVQVLYKTPEGTIKERLLGRADEASISVATIERPWAFDGNGDEFKLAVEAKRIDLAFLFDPMMAVHTSNVEALPHQITAVYESMLPRQPLRFVLADDPGAGKTIMAGLYIRELIMRADSRRILVVAPGSLVEQWRDELFEKFGLQFNVFSSALEAATPTGNPFEDLDHLIVRLDQMARNEEIQEKLLATSWDLVIFDEAHKLAAHFFGSKLEKTGRFILAEKLGARSRHLLLMTATPHSGKEEDFQLFLSLLDSDRFYGRFRDGVHKVDSSDLMRRMVKEELLKFDGTPLRSKLKEFYWKADKPAVKAADFWEDTRRYLYLPRLKDRGVLAQAIVKGAGTRDFFGTAYGQSAEKFEGFKLGDANVQLDDTLLLIEPDAAKAYEAVHPPVGVTPPGPTPPGPVPPGPRPPEPGPAPIPTLKAKTFYGSADVTPATARLRLVTIAEEIIAVLSSDPNATVKITVEIAADFPDGASDQIKRAVFENASHLGFKTKTWE